MCLFLALGLGVPVVPQLGLLFPDLEFPPKQFSPHSPRFLDLLAPYTSASAISRASAVCMTC